MPDNFFLKRFVVGPMGVNCYLVADYSTKDACVIDPGGAPDVIKDLLKKNGYNLKYIINTHGHGDHIAANGSFDAPIYIHKLDGEFLTDPDRNLSRIFLFSITSPEASKFLEDAQTLKLGNLEMKIFHTPGHTPGSVSVKLDGVVFTGDALFRGSIGRTDFVYGDEKALMRSIREKLLTLDDSTIVYPGHGEPSTIGEERKNNPFLV